MDRAYSLLEIRAVDEESWVIEGVASTPTPDRMDDVVEPMGAKYALPMPLLWQHDANQPVGHVEFAKPSAKGIPFRASIVKPTNVLSTTLRERLQLAWDSLKSGLVKAVSIGFRALDYEVMKNGGLRFTSWEWLELSLVTIPAQAEATITSIKSIDSQIRAASGRSDLLSSTRRPSSGGKPAVKAITPSKSPQEGKTMPKTIAEQISAFEATRQAKAARMGEIMDKAAEEGVTLDQEQADEHDGLSVEIKSIDDHLKRLREQEIINASRAVAITPAAGADEHAAAVARAAAGAAAASVRVEVARAKQLPQGIGFTRYVLAMARAKGNIMQAHQMAKGNERWMAETPDVEAVLRSAVAAGTTTDSTWAGPLVQYQNLASEFIEFLRPQTIMGKLNLRPVPFKVKIPRQTAGASVGWVGEGQAATVSKLAFDSVTLDIAKLAGIVVITNELARHGSPSAEMLVRDDLAAQMIQFQDSQFVDPSVALTGSSPASVTNGVSGSASTGNDAAAFRTDMTDLIQRFLANNLGLGDGAFIMSQQQAAAIGMMLNSLGVPLYPTINANGGTLMGIPVIASENIPSTDGSPADGVPIILLKQRDILLADEGQVTIDASNEATLQMDSSPDSPNTGSTNLISLWQQGMLGIKAEREINWIKRRSTSVDLITSAHYQ